MSYDIWLTIDTGGPQPAYVYEVGNYTVNVAPMWAKALGESLGSLIERIPSARDLEPLIAAGIEQMEAAPDDYRAMNPPNRWGDASGAQEYLEKLRAACAAHPKCQVEVSR